MALVLKLDECWLTCDACDRASIFALKTIPFFFSLLSRKGLDEKLWGFIFSFLENMFWARSDYQYPVYVMKFMQCTWFSMQIALYSLRLFFAPCILLLMILGRPKICGILSMFSIFHPFWIVNFSFHCLCGTAVALSTNIIFKIHRMECMVNRLRNRTMNGLVLNACTHLSMHEHSPHTKCSAIS